MNQKKTTNQDSATRQQQLGDIKNNTTDTTQHNMETTKNESGKTNNQHSEKSFKNPCRKQKCHLTIHTLQLKKVLKKRKY